MKLWYTALTVVTLTAACSSSNKSVGTSCRTLETQEGFGCTVKACQTNDQDGDCSEVFYQFAGGERFTCRTCGDCVDAARVAKLACEILPDGG